MRRWGGGHTGGKKNEKAKKYKCNERGLGFGLGAQGQGAAVPDGSLLASSEAKGGPESTRDCSR